MLSIPFGSAGLITWISRFCPSIRTPRQACSIINGAPAAQFSLGGQDALVALEVRDGKIVSLFTVLNPDKLSYLYRQMGGPRPAEGG